MKKIIKLWLVLVLVLGISVNVYAVDDNVLKADDETTEKDETSEGDTTNKEEDKKDEETSSSGGTSSSTDTSSDKESEGGSSSQEGNESGETEKPTEPSTPAKSDKAELISITIDNNIKVQCNSENKCEVNNDEITSKVTKVKIAYEISDKATIKYEDGKPIEDNINLNGNPTKYTVIVTAEDGTTTKKYEIIINKKVLNTDASLKSLIINGEEVSLKEGTLKYNATVSYTAKSIEVEAIPKSNTSKIDKATKNKLTYDFTGDTKEIRVKVISEAADSMTYVINVTRREEADATLRDITIENYELDFEKDKTEYEISVLKDVETLEIKATPTDTDAEVKIEGNDKLEIGENKITITVTNDGTIKTYTIKVNKLDEEDKSLANLESLTIKGYDIDFKEDKYEYDLKIGDDNTLDIDYKTKSPDATVQVTGNMDLVNGSIVKVRVTYTSGLTNVYRINISKDEVVAKPKNNTAKIIIIVAIILILIASILLIVIQIRNKKNKNNKPKNDKGEVNKIDSPNVSTGSNVNLEKIVTASPNDVISMPPDDTEDII